MKQANHQLPKSTSAYWLRLAKQYDTNKLCTQLRTTSNLSPFNLSNAIFCNLQLCKTRLCTRNRHASHSRFLLIEIRALLLQEKFRGLACALYGIYPMGIHRNYQPCFLNSHGDAKTRRGLIKIPLRLGSLNVTPFWMF